MKIKHFYFIFPIVVLILYIYQYMKIDVNLDSVFDEGFLFLKLQLAGKYCVDSGTQWTTIINRLSCEQITSNLLYLRYARFFVHILSVILFSFLSSWYLYKKGILNTFKKKVFFLTLIFLIGIISLGGIIISYNELQEFFLLSVIGCFLVSTVISSKNAFFLNILIGFFSFFSIMTILPSGVLVLVCVLLLMWIKHFKDWKTGLVFTFGVFLGLLLAVLIFQFLIFDLRIVYKGMVKTAETITTLNRGYDPFSFLVNIFLYLRDFYMATCLFLGITLITILLQKYTKQWVAISVFLVSMIAVSVYQKKPEIVFTSFLAFPMIIFFIAILFETPKLNWQSFFSFNTLLLLFLFFVPLISSLGTNVYLGYKMLYFILPWGVLLMELMSNGSIKNKYAKEIRYFLILFILLIVNQPIQSMLHDINNIKHEKLFFNKEKPISQIQLTVQQKEYYEKVYKIMEKYGYKAKDVIFSTQLDHMTIVAFDGTPCGLYFQPMDFLAEKSKQSLKKPEFLFLTKYDLTLMSDSIKSLNWGFPEAYDCYYVGTPEITNTSYPTERWLYCLKDK